jgi:hypothetical protein
VTDFLHPLLDLSNETLNAAIVVIAASMLLYNLSHNRKDRVARTSGALLACVTVVYACEVLIALDPTLDTWANLLRLQWLGVAFVPATTFHLSDALLATTGLPSRGRRKRVVRILYAIAVVFLILALFTDALIMPSPAEGRVSVEMGVLFPIYLIYFLLINGIALLLVERARRRCLTSSTRRRMAYLQVAFLTPSIGIFPYSVLLSPGQEFTLLALLILNLANIFVVLMLLFLSYPLSFFGSRTSDRVVKRELLRFMLRGPATGLLALVVIVYTEPVIADLQLSIERLTPFATVAVILLWQWAVHETLPWLEKRLIYPDENDERIAELQNLTERVLTHSDLMQLLGAVLESARDYLRVNTAFVVSLTNGKPEVVQASGLNADDIDDAQLTALRQEAAALPQENGSIQIASWTSYWISPLFSKRKASTSGNPALIGVLGIQARAAQIDLDHDDLVLLRTSVRRVAQTLDDMLLHAEINAALEGLLPQFTLDRARAAEVEFKPGYITRQVDALALPDRAHVIEQVHAALRHYWGGPGLTSSRLLELQAVRASLAQYENNPVRTLRELLLAAIEKQRPAGERDFKSPEWTLYNILQLRFLEDRKVKDTARRLYMSEANLYRKQNIAIEAVADALLEVEKDTLLAASTPPAIVSSPTNKA